MTTSLKPAPARLADLLYYMLERESVRKKKEKGKPRPWTDDMALNEFRFTNVRRDYDHTTRRLKEELYDPNLDAPDEQVLLNCAIARYFGTAEFAIALGWQKKLNTKRLVKVATQRINASEPVFTGAYTITNGGIAAPKQNVVSERYMAGLWANRKPIITTARATRCWKDTVGVMKKVEGFGGTGFMAKEITLDMMFFPILAKPVDEKTWTPIGPGARKGLNFLYVRDHAVPESRMLDEMRWLLDWLRGQLPKNFPRPRSLHDIQWNLCEYQKWHTITRLQGRGKRSYTPREVLEHRWDHKAKPSPKRKVSDEQMIEIYWDKVNDPTQTNWDLAKKYGLDWDSDIQRAIHRAMARGLVDPEPYQQIKKRGRRHGIEGERDYMYKKEPKWKKRQEQYGKKPIERKKLKIK